MNASGLVHVEIATGGRPLRALEDAGLQLAILPEPPLVIDRVLHDAGCPCLNGRPIAACICEILKIEARPNT